MVHVDYAFGFSNDESPVWCSIPSLTQQYALHQEKECKAKLKKKHKKRKENNNLAAKGHCQVTVIRNGKITWVTYNLSSENC